MTEIDVALTDLALALQAGWFARVFGQLAIESWLRGSLVTIFTGIALAALCGGIWHGFLTAPGPWSDFAWWLTMALVGITAMGYALLGCALLGMRHPAVLVAVLATALIYWIVISFRSDFYLVLLPIVPATAICLAGLAHRRHEPGAGLALAGALLAVLAFIPQQAEIALHPIYLTHNAVYHLILLLAHYLFYRGLRVLALEGDPDHVASR